MLTTGQAARRLSVSTETIRRYYEEGRLTGRRLRPSGWIQIDEASVEALLTEAREQEQPRKEDDPK